MQGTEVKSLRQGEANLSDAYAQVKKGELWLLGMHISPYEQGNRFNHEPLRDRRLLMHKREILKLFGQIRLEGLTLVPLRLYFKQGKVKVALGLAKGRKQADKREHIKRKQLDKAAKQAVKRQLR